LSEGCEFIGMTRSACLNTEVFDRVVVIEVWRSFGGITTILTITEAKYYQEAADYGKKLKAHIKSFYKAL
jgi:hypothetical protein